MSVCFRLGVSIWKLRHLWAAVCPRFPKEEGLASCDAVLPLMLFSPSVGIPGSSLIGLFSLSLSSSVSSHPCCSLSISVCLCLSLLLSLSLALSYSASLSDVFKSLK